MALTPSPPRRGPLARLVAARPLLSFFVLSFAPSFAYEFVCILVLRLPLVPWMFAAPFIGPFAAAFLVTAAVEGRAGTRALVRDLVRWRVGWRWYAVIALGLPAFLMLCVLPLPGAAAAFDPDLSEVGPWLAGFALVLVVGGPLGEEPGWRNFATPRLQERFGPVLGTLVLGVLWGLWHLPLFLIEGYNHAGGDLAATVGPYLVFLGFTVAIAFLFTWLYNSTSGSGPVAVVAHTFFNVTLLPVLFPGVENSFPYEVVQLAAFSVLALVLLAATRGRLGWRGPQAVEACGPASGGASPSRAASGARGAGAAR
ncbi:CPBP family intramembrane glutamic endopeptidase [Glycomyces terrestris]|uniref:CPBP family intramembrane metalloprotease n=1 Tax=Glycomyces terrestris TaxID=2493553 RepID=A0A426UXW0_9ACTN|nr:CPBP family intramembrane glutamic endopeptidase [Glycomyces terrestris]RRR99403.1 CPBP family intramembrane metalloprotease [Glycomyces terrestris]